MKGEGRDKIQKKNKKQNCVLSIIFLWTTLVSKIEYNPTARTEYTLMSTFITMGQSCFSKLVTSFRISFKARVFIHKVLCISFLLFNDNNHWIIGMVSNHRICSCKRRMDPQALTIRAHSVYLTWLVSSEAPVSVFIHGSYRKP